ncbi:hypothetical protein [Alloactinosynnema sp. L-07]|nr:hypothetical protein [Alloactinosynnema sp. L-07]
MGRFMTSPPHPVSLTEPPTRSLCTRYADQPGSQVTWSDLRRCSSAGSRSG